MKTALITGANRGLGLECARQLAATDHHVFLAARNLADAETAADSLPGQITPLRLDVLDHDSIQQAIQQIESQTDSLHILINNAGIYPSGDDNPATLEPQLIQQTLLTNCASVQWIIQAALPLLAAAKPNACIVNVSSGLGSFGQCAGDNAPFADFIGTAYSASKAALNQLTLAWAKHLRRAGSPIRINSVSPGWCRTDMGGKQANRSPQEGAATLLRYAQLHPTGPSGQFFNPDGPCPW
jgi:NAD(P)-dependent dehydrogenase (short-subunit alcohol dehydrogenase family)